MIDVKLFLMSFTTIALINLLVQHDWTSVAGMLMTSTLLALYFVYEKWDGAGDCDEKIDKLEKQISQIEAVAAKASMGQAFAFQRTGK